MASIKINSIVMRDKAGTLKGISNSIKTLTEEMSQEMNNLKSTWEGQVAEETVRKFEGLRDDFQERYDTINKYSEFLEKAAEAWERVDQQNMQNLHNQKS